MSTGDPSQASEPSPEAETLPPGVAPGEELATGFQDDATYLGDPEPSPAATGFQDDATYLGDPEPSPAERTRHPSSATPATHEATLWEGPPPLAASEPREDQTQWSGDGTRAVPAPITVQPGAMFGPYHLVEELGAGGMGVVYRALDTVAGREVALKLIRGQLSEAQRQRFVREGQLTASLNHPNLVRVHAAGEASGTPYLVYELVAGGRTLKEATRLAQPAEQLRLLRDVARGLGHAHAQGVIHRDVKPANVLVDTEGHVRVADFGLAHSEEVERLTRTGAVMGTPAYMAPEQAERERNGPWTDVWALGVMLYEVLTGQRPFASETGPALLLKVRDVDVPSPRELRSGISKGLEAICLKALSRDETQRYHDADAFADDLDRVLCGEAPAALGVDRVERSGDVLLTIGVCFVLCVFIGLYFAKSLVASGVTQPSPLGALRVHFDAPPSAVRAGRLELTARLQPPSARLRVRGGLVREGQDGQVTLTLQVKEGPNAFELVLVDGEHRHEERLEITGLPPWPGWYRSLGAKRPKLPEGLEPTREAGVYSWTRDRSHFVWVPPGQAMIGNRDLGKTFRATLSRGYFLGRHEVTWRSFDRFCAATGRAKRNRRIEVAFHEEDDLENRKQELEGPPFEPGDSHPAIRVTWFDAQAYCAWAGARLPSAVEWEWAARGPEARTYPWGDEPPGPATCNRKGSDDGYSHTSPVGALIDDCSPFGCFDMAGNVREWVEDGFSKTLPPGPLRDYVGPHRDENREVRGGSWPRGFTVGLTTWIRSSHRAQSNHLVDVGFRVAIDAPE